MGSLLSRSPEVGISPPATWKDRGTGIETIGVLGGLSQLATMDFEACVHVAAQHLIPQLANRGYPSMIVYYLRCPPFVMGADFRPVLPLQPGPKLIEAARQMGLLVDTLVITANGPPAPQWKCRPGTFRPLRRKGGYYRDPLQM